MSWSGSSDGGAGRRGYHHGNLREALIEAALELIGAKGPAGFTVAEAARLAGVSPAAPYRHFRDADALLAEVALRGLRPARRTPGNSLEWRPAGTGAGLRGCRAGLPRVRPQRARLLRGDVRIRGWRWRHIPACRPRPTAHSRCCGKRRTRLPRRCRRPPAAVADDGAAHLGDGARDRRRCSCGRGRHGGSCRWRRRTCWRRGC